MCNFVHIIKLKKRLDLCYTFLSSCVLILSSMFPTVFKLREMCNFNQGNVLLFHLVACQWHHIPWSPSRCESWQIWQYGGAWAVLVTVSSSPLNCVETLEPEMLSMYRNSYLLHIFPISEFCSLIVPQLTMF